MKGMKCGKKSAQKLILEIEKEKKNMLIDWLLKKNFSETGWKSGNEWNVNFTIKIMIMNEMWTDTI